MATTLEEYQIVVAANAESAARGINAFRESLTSFSRALQTCLSPIKEFAGAVQDIASASYRMDFSRLANQAERFARSMRKVATASKESGNRGTEAAPLDYAQQFAMETTPQEILEMRSGGVAQRLATELGKDNLNEGRVASLVEQYQKLQSKLAEVQAQAESTGRSLGKTISDAAQSGIGKVEKFVSRIGRIFSTMLIRTAMRAFMKEFSEVWDAMEKYSKDHGGEFAQTMSMIRGSISQAAVSLATALAPAMRVVAAAAALATTAIKVLANAVNWLMGLLGASTEFLGISTEALEGYSTATGGASQKNKDLLASFDELNVIQSQSSGGGTNTGGWDLASFNEQLSQELLVLEQIIAGAMLALGVILTFTGHPGIGIPMMLLGLAGTIGLAQIDWDQIPQDIKETCAKIAEIAGLALLAIGAILTFGVPGQLGLGIGLMLAGGLLLYESVAISWGEIAGNIEEEVKKITDIVGKALLALGAVLTFCGHPGIGITLMAVGALSLVVSGLLGGGGGSRSGGSRGAGDGSIAGTIEEQISRIETACKENLLALGAIFAFTAGNIPLGVGLMIAGGVDLGAAVDLNWDELANNVINSFTKITSGISLAWFAVAVATNFAWTAVLKWENAKWSEFSRSWDTIKLNFQKLWNTIARYATTAWGKMSIWINAKWSLFSRDWDRIKDGFDQTWDNIARFAREAYVDVTVWIETEWGDFYTNWSDIEYGFKQLWGEVRDGVNAAWNKVILWINARWSMFSVGWEPIKGNLLDIWKSVEDACINAYRAVNDVMSMQWGDFSGGWISIKENMCEIWKDIKAYAVDAFSGVNLWLVLSWKKNFYVVWHPIDEGFLEIWTNIANHINGAKERIKKWWDDGPGSVIASIKSVWAGIVEWFDTNIIGKIVGLFNSVLDKIKGIINKYLINPMNELGHVKYGGLKIGTFEIIPAFETTLWHIDPLKLSTEEDRAGTARGSQTLISGDVGASVASQMSGRASGSDQSQIIEGVRQGVKDANTEQNELLRELCGLATEILQKDSGFGSDASIAFGRFAKRSIALYNQSMGGK